jgi:hypothetical protein
LTFSAFAEPVDVFCRLKRRNKPQETSSMFRQGEAKYLLSFPLAAKRDSFRSVYDEVRDSDSHHSVQFRALLRDEICCPFLYRPPACRALIGLTLSFTHPAALFMTAALAEQLIPPFKQAIIAARRVSVCSGVPTPLTCQLS